MADDTIYTDGLIPVDLTGAEEWLSGAPTYEPGECEFEVIGYKPAPKGKKGMLMVHKIITGHEKNVGRNINRYFDFGSKNPVALNFLKGYCLLIGGKEALQGGKPNMRALVGARFKATIFSGTFKDAQGNERAKFDIDFQSAVVTRKANGGPAANPFGGITVTS